MAAKKKQDNLFIFRKITNVSDQKLRTNCMFLASATALSKMGMKPRCRLAQRALTSDYREQAFNISIYSQSTVGSARSRDNCSSSHQTAFAGAMIAKASATECRLAAAQSTPAGITFLVSLYRLPMAKASAIEATAVQAVFVFSNTWI